MGLFLTIVAAIVVGVLILSFLDYVLMGLLILLGVAVLIAIWIAATLLFMEAGVRDDGTAVLLGLIPPALTGGGFWWVVERAELNGRVDPAAV